VFVTVTVTWLDGVPVAVLGKDTGRGVMEIAGAVAVPVPVIGAVAVKGVVPARAFTTNVSVKFPTLPGENFTVTVQVALTASVAPATQVCAEMVKYGAVDPVKLKAGLPNCSEALPVFLIVTTSPLEVEPWVMDPKVMGLGVMVMAGKMPVPVRLEETVAALLRIFRPADSSAVVEGVKTTAMKQVFPAGSVDMQSDPPTGPRVKSAGLLPPAKLKNGEAKVAETLLTFVMVNCCGALGEPCS
jgi:hypothetical protein